MLELGKYSKKLHIEIGKILIKHPLKILMLLVSMLNGFSITLIKIKKGLL